MIIKSLVVGPFGTNCYIVGSEENKTGIVIDPGSNAETIVKTIKKMNLKILYIVITHLHIDHVGALKEVKDATSGKVSVYENEYTSLWKATLNQLSSFGVTSSYFEPDILLKDGDTINIGDLGFVIVSTPGHTAGGISLVGHDIVFSGDTLFNYGIGRTDFPGGSYKTIIESIKNKLLSLPDNTVVYPGHGPSTTIGNERRVNPFLR